MSLIFKTKKEVIKIDGKLKEILTVQDEKGNILHKIISPLMVEFKIKDLIQIMIGSAILAIPVGFTTEIWDLGTTLPLLNVIIFIILSFLFISIFVYHNYYRKKFKKHWLEFVKRVVSTYVFSFATVALLLFLINVTPWSTDWLLAFKRVVIVAFPASMSAAVADMIK